MADPLSDAALLELMAESAGLTVAALKAAAEWQSWAEAMAASLVGIQEDIEASLYAQYVGAISAELNPVAYETAVNMAADKARQEAGTLVTNMATTEINMMGEQIAEGLAAGRNPIDIARTLDSVAGLDSRRAKEYQAYVAELEDSLLDSAEIERRAEQYYQQLLKDRRETITLNETRRAQAAARNAEAKARNATWKVWITVGDGRVSDACQLNEAQGPIPINDTFEGGVDTEPQHVNCRCTVMYGTSDDHKQRATAQAEERAKVTADAKEEKGA